MPLPISAEIDRVAALHCQPGEAVNLIAIHLSDLASAAGESAASPPPPGAILVACLWSAGVAARPPGRSFAEGPARLTLH
jgi:hypothetical protein